MLFIRPCINTALVKQVFNLYSPTASSLSLLSTTTFSRFSPSLLNHQPTTAIQRTMSSEATTSTSTHTSITATCLADLRNYWFEHAPVGRADEDFMPKAAADRWFNGGEAVDDHCRLYFATAVEQARKTPIADLVKLAQDGGQNDALGLVLLLDQMPRNIYRGSQAAIAYNECDPRALAVVKACIGPPYDYASRENCDSWWQQAFFHMPLVHSESLQDHELLHEKLHQGQSSAESEPERKAVGTTLSFEMKHYHVLKRFGRYPSRNEALQRQSTKEEEEFLKENGAGW